ncbi:MAG: TolC family protein [Planctomycetes bacterium]|jgi:outer membrane protein TolC|nr:TolC family protein [Planctomycetota bacterium]
MVRRTTLVAVILLARLAAGAGPGLPAAPTDANIPETLTEYLQYAARHSPALQAAFEDWRAAVEQIPQAKALPDPTFTYNYFIRQIDDRQRVGLMQMFPWFGTIAARTDAAAAAAKAAQSRYDVRRRQLFAEVKQAFYEYVYLAGATRVAQENLTLMQHFEEVARTKYITAAAAHPDIVRAQIEVARLQNELITLERQRTPVVARLHAALNRPSGALLPWPRSEPDSPAEIDREVLLATLRDRNPELQAMESEVERLNREVAVARRNFYPDIGVGAEWMQMPMSGGGNEQDMLVGIQLNVPIWRGSYRAGEMQARAMARRAQHERKDLENSLVARTERALFEFENSGREVRLYRDVLVPRSQELVDASETAYMAGTIDFLRLIDAQQTLLRFQLARERAQVDQRQRLAELEMLAGADLP